MIERFTRDSERLSAEEMAATVVKESGIAGMLSLDRSEEGVSKWENVQELLAGIAEFCELRREEGIEQVSLSDFLSEVSLLTDLDNDKEEQADKVTLMTVHGAKGLEFRNVFVVGVEEDLFPSSMSKDSPRGVEEERRLFYVALTRAEENCVLTFAKSRFRNGKSMMCSPSRFLRDIDAQFLDLPLDMSRAVQRKEPTLSAPSPQIRRTLTRVEAASPASSASHAVVADFSGLRVGAKVRHDRFGDGVVTALEGDSGNAKATVSFVNFGQKQLLLKFARLTIIG